MKAGIKKVLLWAFGFLAVAILGIYLYLQFADLSGWCEAAVDAASDALGRKISVAGECRPDIGFPASLVLEEVSIANPGWSDQPEMVSVERFVFVLDLWSVVNRPVRVPRVRLEGGRLLLETEGGRNNWSFGGSDGESADEPGPPPNASAPGQRPAEDSELMVVLEDIVLRDVALTFQADGVVRVALSVEELKLGFREAGMFHLEGAGALNEKRFELAGDVGPFEELMTLGAVTADLEAKLLGTEVALKASFGDLASLAEPVIDATVRGSDLQTVTTGLGLPDLGSGTFSLSGRLTGPSLGETVDVRVEIASDLVEGEIEGLLGSVLDPKEIEARIALRGTALEAVAAVSGVEELPAGPFDLEGGLKWTDDSLELEQIVGHVGPNSLTADGRVSFSRPRPEFDVVLSADGPDLTAIVDLPSLALPSESFRVSGRVASLESGFELDGVEVALGASSARVEGVLGAIPDLEGTRLQVEVSSPNLSSFSALAGVALPPMSAELSGGVALGGNSATLTAVTLALGEHQGEFDGSVVWSAPFVGSDLVLALEGPSLAALVSWIPPEMVELPVLPEAAYRVAGRLAVGTEGYQLSDVEIDLGDETVSADGLLGLLPELEGSDLTLELSSPDLTTLADLAAPFVELPVLPAESLSLTGRVQVAGGVYRLDGVQVELGQNHVEATGSVGPLPDLSSTDLDLQLSGPNLGDVLDHLAAAGFDELPLLPRAAFSVEGGVKVLESGYALREVRAQLGAIELSATGMLGTGELLAGSDLEVEVSGPDLSVFGTLTEVSLPPEPFRLSGRIERGIGNTRVEGLRALLGDVNLEAEGVIGDPPDLESSDVELRVHSGGTRLFARFLGPDIPEGVFEAKGRFSGGAENFAVGALRARLGRSDVTGTVKADFRTTPEFEVLLTSDLLDLGELFDAVTNRRREEAEVEAEEVASADPAVTGPSEAETKGEPRLLFVDDPIGFRGLMKLNGLVRYRVEHLTSPSFDLEEIEFEAELRDGALHLLPTSFESPNGASMTARLSLVPDDNGYVLDTRIDAEDLRILGVLNTADMGAAPSLNFGLDLKASGDTPHQMMSNANGVLILEVGAGSIAGGLFGFINGNVLFEVLGAVVPTGTEEPPTEEIECVIALGELEDGVMKIEPMLLRTPVTDLAGRGRINFETEALDLKWSTEHRKGIGLSLGAMTQSAFKLGGTLTSPGIEITPLDTALRVGVTGATLGWNLVLENLWGRITGHRDLCSKGLNRAEKARKAFRKSQRAAGVN